MYFYTVYGQFLDAVPGAFFGIAQLEKQAEKRFARIGRHVYEVLVKEGRQTVSRGTTEIKKLLQDVEELEKTIDDKEKDL